MSLLESLKRLLPAPERVSEKVDSQITNTPPAKFNDNLNYMLFSGEGTYEKTGRKRKFKIEAFSEPEAIQELESSGYVPGTINICRVPFDPPSEEQIAAMKKHKNRIPQNACKDDISFLIEKAMYDQRNPDKQLIDFANGQKVKFSYYTGEQSLYDRIWNKFSLEEKFAFYLACVKKDKTTAWNFGDFDRYKNMAPEYLNDDKFMNSFKRYSGKGNHFRGFMEDTTSRNTNCYKIATSII